MPTVHVDWTISLGQMAVSGSVFLLCWLLRLGWKSARQFWGEHLVFKAHVMRQDNLTEKEFHALAREAAGGYTPDPERSRGAAAGAD